MTVLDQAFIKAYLRRREKPSVAALDATEPDPFGPIWQESAGEPTIATESSGDAESDEKAPEGEAAQTAAAAKGSPHCEVSRPKPATLPLGALEIAGSEIAPQMVAAIAASGPRPPSPRSEGCGRAGLPDAARAETQDCGRSPAAAIQPDAGALQPLLRIDRVVWPEASERLCRVASEQINRVAEAIQKAARSGRRLIGVAGFSPSEGCTTVLLALAKRLVEVGCKTLLLDADVVNPGLPERLGLRVDWGWREVASGEIELEEAVTESDCESLALLPYCGSRAQGAPALPHGEAIDRILARLRMHYDVVLMDLGGSLTSGGRDAALAGELSQRMDSVLTVQNVRTTSASHLEMLRQHLRRNGVAEAGVIENFTEG